MNPDSTTVEDMTVRTRQGSIGITVNSDDDLDPDDMEYDEEQRPKGMRTFIFNSFR